MVGKNNLLNVFKESLHDFLKFPLIIVPSLFLFVFLYFFSVLSDFLSERLQTNFSLTIWLIFFGIIFLSAASFIFSGLIGLSFDITKRKVHFGNFFGYCRKFSIRNFFIMIIILFGFNAIRLISHYGAFFIGKFFDLPVSGAEILFFLIYFAGLAGVIIFLAFSNFYLVFQDLSFFDSIKKSVLLVKKEYVRTLFVIILFFVINEILNLLNNVIIVELVNSLVLAPYLALVLARFVVQFDFRRNN